MTNPIKELKALRDAGEKATQGEKQWKELCKKASTIWTREQEEKCFAYYNTKHDFEYLANQFRPAISQAIEYIERLEGELGHAAVNFDFLLKAIKANDPQLELELRCKDGARYAKQALAEREDGDE